MYDDRMDPECIPICDALNKIGGVQTFESCCGHAKHPMWIFFTARRVKSLVRLMNALNEARVSGWKVTLSCSSANRIYYVLEGPELPDAHKYRKRAAQRFYEQSREIATHIQSRTHHGATR